MSVRTRLLRLCLAIVVAGAVAFALGRLPVFAQTANPVTSGKPRDQLLNFDVRISTALRAQVLQRTGRAQQTTALTKLRAAGDELVKMRADLPGVMATMSAATGGAEMVRNPRGALTAAGGGDSAAIVSGFLSAHAPLYGLTAADVATVQFRGESINKGNGLRMLRGEQVINGIPVFESDLRFILDRSGRLIRTLGALASSDGAASTGTPALSSSQAFVKAMASVNIPITADNVTRTFVDTKEQLTVANPHIAGPVTSKLVLFPIAPGVLVLAYEQFAYTDGPGDWITVVDAINGDLLWRKNTRAYQVAPTQEARFSVYVQADGKTPADSPAPQSPTTAVPGAGTQYPEISRTIVSMFTAQDLGASPAGWLPDGATTTTGNNVDACMDRVGGAGEVDVCDVGTIDNNGRPVGNPDVASNNRDFLGNAVRDFNYSPAPQGGNPDAGDDPTGTGAVQIAYRRGIVTNLFYVVNWYHDQLFNLGFDEAAGNFQTTNFSGLGAGGDAVRADAQDSSGTDNSNFSTPPDGTPGRMQMYRFTGPTPNRDGDLDGEIMLHELTHGTSNRLMGNGHGLQWNVGGGMGEGWSDFYALSLLNNTNADDPDGKYAMGAYATYKLRGTGLTDNYVYGIRRFPYSTDNTVNPLGWKDVDDVTRDYSGGIPISPVGFEGNGGLEVHNVGEVWALTLWEVRSRVIHDPAGANGDVPTGNHTMLQLVTDAMKLTPANPSFIDARDALIDADCATNACANERSIWAGFADRGLGYGAVAPLSHMGFDNLGHMSLGTSSATPKVDVGTVTIDDSTGNNNGAVDPGEPVKMTVQLVNPWHRASFAAVNTTATISTTTPGVTISDNSSSYGTIVANGTAIGDTFAFKLSSAPTCGSSIDFTITVTSSLGTSSSTFSVRVGTPNGTGSPITYTATLGVPLAIPDNTPVGVSASQTITDDFEIADLNFRVDNIQHTFTGDLTVNLRAPNGYGGDLIFLRNAFLAGGDGNNFINTVIDDQSVNDLNQSPDSSAPFTGDWLPAFGSPFWNLFGDPGITPDPVGQLGRLNGTSTKGTWTVLVADNAALDTGTLHAWSLIVTPRAFSCTAFVDATPPTTTINVTPAAPNGANGWYVTPVNVAVSATDDNAVSQTRCALDPASAPAAFTDLPASCAYTGAGGPIAANGLHAMYAASIDTSLNAETPVSKAIKIDTTPPVLTCTAPAPSFTLHQAGATVTANVTDAVSGAASPTASAVADTSTSGPHTVTVNGADAAGNTNSVLCAYTVGAAPTVTIATPTTNPTLTAKTPFITLGGTAAPSGSAIAQVTWSNDRGGSGTASGTTVWSINTVPLQAGTNVITVSATDTDGNTGTDTLTVSFTALTYYLAEGSTGGFFSMDVAIANPNATPAHVTITFLDANANTTVQDKMLPATSRTTIHVNDIPGLEATPVSVIVSSLDVLPLGVERTMSWDNNSYGGHGDSAVDAPRAKWYFAEGSQGYFHTYVLILNPNAAANTATVTFLPEAGAPIVKSFPMPALSRLVVDCGSVPEVVNSSFGLIVEGTSPLVAERSMYFASTPSRIFKGGHNSGGTADLATHWLFAEGATGSFFDTFILLGNPGNTDAHVTMRYLLDNGATVTTQKVVPANGRLTVSVEGEDPQLASAAMSTEVTSDMPIVAERSMYWVGDPLPWMEGHNSVGLQSTGTKWVLAEGRVGGTLGYQTYILLGNPTNTAANVMITYLKTDGTTVTGTYVVPPTSRFNVAVNDLVPTLHDESFGALVTVTNGIGIIVERSLYWNSGGVVWSAGTSVTGSQIP